MNTTIVICSVLATSACAMDPSGETESDAPEENTQEEIQQLAAGTWSVGPWSDTLGLSDAAKDYNYAYCGHSHRGHYAKGIAYFWEGQAKAIPEDADTYYYAVQVRGKAWSFNPNWGNGNWGYDYKSPRSSIHDCGMECRHIACRVAIRQ